MSELAIQHTGLQKMEDHNKDAEKMSFMQNHLLETMIKVQ